MMKCRNSFLACMLLNLSFFLCGAEIRAANDSVVATVGRFTITRQDLMDSYEFGPAFVKRLPDPMRRHLELMINERLLALDGESTRMDTTMFVRERVAALEEDLAVEQLYREEILSQVKLTEREINAGLQKAKTNLRMRWIYAPNKGSAERIAGRLKGGAPFDELYRAEDDSTGRKLETNLLQLESDVPDFAKAIRSLRVNEVSAPLPGPDGYYLVRIDQAWQNPLLTETERTKLSETAVRALRKSKANALADNYVKAKMRAANPVIKAEGYNIVRAFLADKGLSRDTQLRWNIPATFMTEAGPMPIGSSEKFLSRPLVTFAGRMLQVRDYVRWFDIRQLQLKRSSPATFNASVKQSIWKMVQDRLLSEEAYARKLNRRDDVRHETGKWEAKLLYLAARTRVARSVAIPESAVRKEFERQKKRASSTSGRSPDFDGVRQQLWEELYHQEEKSRLSGELRRLRAQHPVSIDEEILKQLARQYLREPQAIDVKIYKPGGTFPRVAFPTIDERWQGFSR